MPDEVALARSGDFQFAVKVTVLDHFDPVVLAESALRKLGGQQGSMGFSR